MSVLREVSILLEGGESRKLVGGGGGDQILFLRYRQRGMKRSFRLKGGNHLYFLNNQNILLNILDSRERDCQTQLNYWGTKTLMGPFKSM